MAKKSDEIKAPDVFDPVIEKLSDVIPAQQLLDAVFGIRRNLHEQRLTKFLEDFQSEFFRKLGRQLRPMDFSNEGFSDSFVSVAREVVTTKSESKRLRFRKLLLNQAITPSEDYLFDKFVAMLSDVDDVQILLLEKIQNRKTFQEIKSLENLDTLFDPPKSLKYEDFGTKPSPTVDIIIGNEVKTFPRSHFRFLALDLLSKGLIVQDSLRDSRQFQLNTNHGYIGDVEDITILKEQLKDISESLQKHFDEVYRLSDVAKKFLNFIKIE